jgi:hypothetical protein
MPEAEVCRVDPGLLPTSMKEAVVDALVNLTYAHASGAGSVGRCLFGARPRTVLNSGFILPQQSPGGDDEVTSPIWISSHGVQLQVERGVAAIITAQPRLGVYVRVLPTADDLKRPNCAAAFRLRGAVADEVKAQRNARLDEEWEKVKGAFTSRARHPGWREIRERIVAEVYAAKGIPTNLTSLDSEEPAADDGEVGEAGASPPIGVATTGGAIPPIQDVHFEPMKVPHKWLRLDVETPVLVLDTGKSYVDLQATVREHSGRMKAAIDAALKAWIESDDAETGGKLWGYRRGVEIPASQYRKWPDFLDAVRKSSLVIASPDIDIEWNLHIADDWLDHTKTSLLLAIENKSTTPHQHRDDTDEAIFQIAVTVRVPADLHCPLRLERIDPSYRYNQYLRYAAMGHNCGINSTVAADHVELRTTWAPRYVQPRIAPTTVKGVVSSIRALSEPSSLDGLFPVLPALKVWLEQLPNRIDPLQGLSADDAEGRDREQDAFARDMKKWQGEYEAIKSGLDVLSESRQAWKVRGPQADPKATVYEAWLAMNEAMADFMKARFKREDSTWRLFQLAFIIANVPSLASRITEFKHHYRELRDDSVTLLYFATGGGKSEAFFGLLLFNLLLDRLRGKSFGVTAMLRYPLRLLTIQQAQRCSRVLAHAELVRRDRGYGGQQFSLGFWVGSTGSPNRHNSQGVKSIPEIEDAPPDPVSEKKLQDDDQRYMAAWRAWNKIPKCPFCGSGTALRQFAKQGGTIAHVCTDIKCRSNSGTWTPLPFFMCDEDIYELAPSVLLGTVDKLALIGHSPNTIRRIYGMFGCAPWQDSATGRLVVPIPNDMKDGPAAKGMQGLIPAYPNGKKLFHDPFPSLLIQDEAHLLDESLGAFAGLFESTLDAVFEHLSKSLGTLVARDPEGKRRRAKVIAASATVSEPERQLEHLYQRAIPAVQFPHPGPTLYDSFYAEPQLADEASRQKWPDIELAAKQARLYCAFMTNGKPHTATSVGVLSNFHLCISRLFQDLTSQDAVRIATSRGLLDEFVSAGPLADIHRQALAAAGEADLATAIDLHRIALTYVTNKKGGDQIMAAESEETRKRHINASVELDGLDTRLITGSVEQGEIQAVVQAAQTRDDPGKPFTPLSKVLRSVIATSAISHGVDVEELNSMFFAGMPSDIAEYIQASSRVGRTHVGFVILVPTPQRRRDRHIIEVFDIFHRFLERMVSPAAIDRWAERAVERVYPSLFQAFLTGVVPTRKVIDLDETEKHHALSYSFIPDIRREYRDRGGALINEINAFVELAIGLKEGFAPEGADHYRQMIDAKTRWFLDTWASSKMWGDGPLRDYFDGQADPMKKPMTSLRDVDQGGLIHMSYRDTFGHKQSGADVLRVMDIVRNGVADNSDSGA